MSADTYIENSLFNHMIAKLFYQSAKNAGFQPSTNSRYNKESFLKYVSELFSQPRKSVTLENDWEQKHVSIVFTQVDDNEAAHCVASVSVDGVRMGVIHLSRSLDAEPKEDGSDIFLSMELTSAITRVYTESSYCILSDYIAIFFPLSEDIKEPSE